MTEIPAEFTLQIQVLLGHDAVTFEGSKLIQKVSNHFPINNTASYHIGPIHQHRCKNFKSHSLISLQTHY